MAACRCRKYSKCEKGRYLRSLRRSPLFVRSRVLQIRALGCLPGVRIWLALLLAIFALNALVLVGGRSRIPSAPTLSTGGLASMLPYGYVGRTPADTIENDMGGAFNASYNYDRYLGRSLRQGSIPLWDPNLGFGMPHLGNGLSAVLYPLNWLHVLVPPKFTDGILFLNWILGAVFLALFLRLVGVDNVAACFGGLIVLCSGWFSSWLGLREITGVAAWFPFLLYGIERSIVEPRWHWGPVALALGVFCTITAGHPEAFIPSLLTSIAFGLCRIWQEKKKISDLARLALGPSAGILLAAPMWLTFIETVGYANQPHDLYPTPAGFLAVNSVGFSGYIFPLLFGSIHKFSFVDLVGREYTSPGWNPPALGFFVIAGLFGTKRKGIFFAVLFALVAAKIWNVPGIQMIAKLPALNEVIWPRYGAYLLVFSLAVLASFGFAHLRQSSATWKLSLSVWFTFVIIVASVSAYQVTISGSPDAYLALATLGLGLLWALLPPVALYFFVRTFGSGWKFVVVAALSLMLPAVAYNTGGFDWAETIVLSSIYLLTFAAIVVLMAILPLSSSLGTYLLIALTIVIPVIAFANRTGGGPPKRYDVLKPPPYIEKLTILQRTGLYRTFSFDGAPMPNVQTALGLPGLGWIVPLVPETFHRFYKRFFDISLQTPNWYAANIVSPRPPIASIDELHRNIRFFSMVGVRYITSQYTPVLQGSATRIAEIAPADSTTTRIFENPDAIPRLFLAPEVVAVDGIDGAWDRLETFRNPSRTVAVEGGASSNAECDVTPMEIKRFEVWPNSVRASIDVQCTGMLVLTDLLVPGWHATLNGEAQPIHRVDGVFRGLQIQRTGSYEVVFWYRPKTWNISLGMMFVALIAVAWASFRRRRAQAIL